MPPSIAEGPEATPGHGSGSRITGAWAVGLLLVLSAVILYGLSNPAHRNFYNHFVWQADAFLHGRTWIPYPVYAGAGMPRNDYLNDVFPLLDADGRFSGRALIPFPPLPALLLLPLVALWGLATDQETVATALGALGVAAAWWMLGGLRQRLVVRALTTILFATGTAWWWAAATGSTWYLAHLVAVIVAFAAVGVALRRDPQAPDESSAGERRRVTGEHDGRSRGEGTGGDVPTGVALPEAAPSRLRRLGAATWPLDRSQVLAGFLLGVAVTARMPVLLAAPWFVFVGGGGSRLRRLLSAGVGGILPVVALLSYTYLTSGAIVHPGYDYQYQLEATGYPSLGYHRDWALEDPRYVPRNLGIMLFEPPSLLPAVFPDSLGFKEPVPLCVTAGSLRTLFDAACPVAVPVDVGTGLLLSAPGLLLALIALWNRRRSRLVAGTVLAVTPIALFNLAHFSQGWVQWGYRFSLDFLPFLLPLVALGAARADGSPRRIAWVLLVAGAAINLWGVSWGKLLGW